MGRYDDLKISGFQDFKISKFQDFRISGFLISAKAVQDLKI